MNLKAFKRGMPQIWLPPKLYLVMKITVILLFTSIMSVSAATFAQKITLSEKNASLEAILTKIRIQSGYDFVYNSKLIKEAKPITVTINNASLEDALKLVLNNEQLVFFLEEQTVMIKKKEPSFLDRVVDAFIPPIDVRGTVLDEKGFPLPGVTVRVKGTNKATSTDNSGKFYLNGVDDDAVIEFRIIGYKVKEIPAKGKFDGLKMEILSKELEEVVVAYGKTTQQALTGAVTVVKGEQIASLPNRSFDKSLQGLVPGLQITGGTGQPGGGIANMVLRGIATGSDATSAGQTFRNPLIVIDGIPVSQDNFQFPVTANVTPVTNPLAQLNPSDIESISVLKDAAAIALYGSQASNGVILVTTKKGKAGKTMFNVRQQTDFSTRLKGETEVLNTEEYLNLLYETYRNTPRVVNGVSTVWTDADILADLKTKFPVRADGNFYPAPDWYSELFTNRATTVSTEAGMSGGNDKNNFYLNFEYTKQNGAVKKTGYDRKSMRFNFESHPSTWLKLGTNTTLSYNIQDYNDSEAPTSFATGTTISPLNPIRLEDGNYKLVYPFGTVSTALNPVADAEYNLNRVVAYRGLSKLYAELRLMKYFSFTSSIGADFMLAELKKKNDPRFYAVSSSVSLPSIIERDNRRANIINTNALRFDKSFAEKHTVSLLLGQEAQIITTKLLEAEARGTAETLPYYEQLGSPGYTMAGIRGNTTRQTLLSVFGQANYGYLNRYFLTASIRKDGSSKFGDQSQWGTYWSAGTGWVVSEEKFIKTNTASWLDYLKIRGSVGAAGNSGAVNAGTRFDEITAIKFLGKNGGFLSSLGNPEIQWEETFTWDVGLEIRLLNERISFTADIYHKKTNDLIYSTNLPSVSGSDRVLANIGDMENSGYELSVSGVIIQKKGFRWNFNTNWSSNQNKLIKANVPLTTISGGMLANEEGRNFNSFYMPVWAGVNPADGKPQWIDANGNPTSTYANAKKEFVGKPQPDGYGAVTNVFKYKDLELSAQLYYQYGSKIFDATLSRPLLTDGRFPYNNQVKGALDYWKKPGDISANPRRLLNNTSDGGTNVSTRYLSKGDYMRLQNITLGYSLPKTLLTQLHLMAVKVYLQGHNLATITRFPGPDPDNASVGGSTAFAYPNQRSFSAGVNVSF
jgi:TonB-linked SusC/RagA family outer membrane protein